MNNSVAPGFSREQILAVRSDDPFRQQHVAVWAALPAALHHRERRPRGIVELETLQRLDVDVAAAVRGNGGLDPVVHLLWLQSRRGLGSGGRSRARAGYAVKVEGGGRRTTPSGGTSEPGEGYMYCAGQSINRSSGQTLQIAAVAWSTSTPASTMGLP